MNIELGPGDLNLIHVAIERQLSGLREELVRTDDRDYRQALRDDVARLEALLQRVNEARRVPTSDAETDPP